jgi:hypothetical protein
MGTKAASRKMFGLEYKLQVVGAINLAALLAGAFA